MSGEHSKSDANPNQATLTERPAEGSKQEAGSSTAPSKNALKKAAKEREKAEKAAKRKEAEKKQKQEAAANDISTDDYGELPMVGSAEHKSTGTKRLNLAAIAAQYSPNDSTDPVTSPPTDSSDGGDIAFRAVVENARVQSAKLAFLVLRQGLASIQAVVAASDTLSRQMVKFSGSIPAESMVLVHGLVKRPMEPVKSASISHLEIHVTKLYVISKAEIPLPLQIEDAERPLPAEGEGEQQQQQQQEETKAGTEGNSEGTPTRPLVTLNTRLNNRVLDLRGKHNQAIFAIKDGICLLFQEYLRKLNFIGVQTPKLLGAASEGGSNVFEVKYFNTNAYLAQSPQLYKQMLVASRFERVFEIGPIFRAENSNTARHLTEFTGLDLEMAFEEDYHEVVELLEGLMLHIFNGLRDRYGKETELVRSIYGVEEFKLPERGQVPRIDFVEGVKMLRADGVEIGDYEDLTTPQEKHLGKLILDRYGTDFYILDAFPAPVRPFYTFPSPHDPQISHSYDFFMRGQEILSGGQRIHDAELLKKRMRAQTPPVDPDSAGLRDYVNAFRYGAPPHAGAGIGLERIVMLWLGLPNVRLASVFPRDPGRLVP